jgi:methyl-accepting chemotaxis protein
MKKMTLKSKLLSAFLCTGLIPVFAIGLYSYSKTSSALESEALAKIEAITSLKSKSIERYFKLIEDQALTFSHDESVKAALVNFTQGMNDYLKDNDISSIDLLAQKQLLVNYYTNEYGKQYEKINKRPVDSLSLLNQLTSNQLALQSAYIASNSNPLGAKHLLDSAGTKSRYHLTHGVYHPNFREYLEKFEFYDIFLVDGETGNVVYTVFKELDFATSLKTGPYKDSGLARAFNAAMELGKNNLVVMEDYDLYRPSYDGPAGFISAPVWVNGEKKGAIVFQISFDKINSIMLEKSGDEKTLETFMVGPDFKMRSDAMMDENRTVIASYKNPEKGSLKDSSIENGLAGKSGSLIGTDYFGKPSLESYRPVSLIGKQWVVKSFYRLEEAFNPIYQMRVMYAVFVVFFVVFVSFFAFWFARNLATSLMKVTLGLSHEAETVGKTSDVIAEVSSKLSEATTEQAASLQETVASIDEISAMIARNADSASTSAKTSEYSTLAAQKGKDKVELMMGSINAIASGNNEIIEQMRVSNREISEIVKVIEEISLKTQVINDIVFQTKLLSFNASVEAARAGEHGKGFAVVAEEVGNLASMSGKAATEITDMLTRSVKRVTDIVDGTKDLMENLIKQSKEKVEFGTNTAKDCAQSLDEILSNVSSVNEMVREISVASHEQAAGVREVNKAMSELDQVTQANSIAAQEASHTGRNLKSQAERLNALVDNLRFLVEGTRSTSQLGAHDRKEPTGENLFHLDVKKDFEDHNVSVKKVVGIEYSVPRKNDSRFQDT